MNQIKKMSKVVLILFLLFSSIQINAIPNFVKKHKIVIASTAVALGAIIYSEPESLTMAGNSLGDCAKWTFDKATTLQTYLTLSRLIALKPLMLSLRMLNRYPFLSVSTVLGVSTGFSSFRLLKDVHRNISNRNRAKSIRIMGLSLGLMSTVAAYNILTIACPRCLYASLR